MQDDERSNAVRAIYAAFDRACKADIVAYVCEKTQGINTGRFFDACRAIEAYGEIPKNISREIINIAGGLNPENLEGCQNCCVYRDGKPEIFEGERVQYAAGLRKYYRTTGTMYDMIGYTTPCTCGTGRRIKQAIMERGGYSTVAKEKAPEPQRIREVVKEASDEGINF